MINAKDKQILKTPLEALADLLTEVWTMLSADGRKAPAICYDNGELDTTNDFDRAQAMYVENDNFIVISKAFDKSDWTFYGETVKKAVHELYHAFQVQIMGRKLNYKLFNLKDGTVSPEYYNDKNEIEAHAFAEWFDQYWRKITTRNEHIPAIPECGLLPKHLYEKEYKKIESRYCLRIQRSSENFFYLTGNLLKALKLI